MGDVPFHEVYIHGLVRDSEGQKMSKSKGNILDPIDVIDGIELEPLVKKRTSGLMRPKDAPKIEKQTRKTMPDGIPAFGTDALRFTFAALATTGRDVVLSMARVEGYRNFCNKLWNATRYVLMNTENQDCGQDNGKLELNAADHWILSRLQDTSRQVTEALEQYRLDHVANAIYDFTWNEYCDWYLELSKPVLNDPASSEQALRGTRHTLVQVLEAILRLSHPVMPYITEEIWQKVGPLAGKQGETIMRQPFPLVDDSLLSDTATQEMEWVKACILGVRKIRGEMNISPGKPLPVFLQDGSDTDKALLSRHQHYLNNLARIESITWLEKGDEAPESATSLVGDMKVLIPMAGLIDKEAETSRLMKEIERLEKDYQRTEGKLSNSQFVDRAPEAVVEKERAKLTEMQTAIGNLKSQLKRIQAI
jgi:valyl-tRNA synthetase